MPLSPLLKQRHPLQRISLILTELLLSLEATESRAGKSLPFTARQTVISLYLLPVGSKLPRHLLLFSLV